MKTRKIIYIPFVFLAVFFFSCKDNTVKPPQVYLDYPQEGSSFNAGDTILFKVRVISEDLEIKNLLVYLSDGNVQVFSPVKSYQVNLFATTIIGNFKIPSYIENGTYFLTFKVETEEDTYKYFFRISIQEMPLEIEAFAGAYDNTLFILNDSLQLLSQINFQDSILDIKPINGCKSVYVRTTGIPYSGEDRCRKGAGVRKASRCR
jgi:hypothetical protein